MSNREKLTALIESVPDAQVDWLYQTVTQVLHVMAEAEDDAFCLALAEQAEAEDDGTRYSFEELMAECGVTDADLQN